MTARLCTHRTGHENQEMREEMNARGTRAAEIYSESFPLVNCALDALRCLVVHQPLDLCAGHNTLINKYHRCFVTIAFIFVALE